MKHLNPNLDSITNVELKQAVTGSIRFLGVDGNNDIVEAELPAGTGDGSVNLFSNQQIIELVGGYYFDAPSSSFSSDCWTIGNTIELDVQDTPPPGAPYDDHTGVTITGTISSVEEMFDDVTEMFTARRIFVDNLSSIGADDAFDGRTAFGGIAGEYALATGTAGMYCLNVPQCTVNNNTGGGFDRAPNSAGRSADDESGALLFEGSNTITANTRTVSAADDYTFIYNLRNYHRWSFWGWDTEEDGTPVVHPDTGLPAVVVAENSVSPASPLAEDFYTTTPAGVPTVDDINRLPDPNDTTFTGGQTPVALGLMTRDGATNNYSVVGGGPYAIQDLMGAAVITQYGVYIDVPPNDDHVQYSTLGRTGGSFPEMGQTQLGGRLRLPNTAGDRQPNNAFAAGTHAPQPYFTLGPASTTTGLNYRSQFEHQGVPATLGVNKGWSPFFSVRSGSGAVRASDGRYYINATPNGTSNAEPTAADLTRDPSGFYVNGTYSNNGGTSRDASWTVKYDRTIYKILSWDNISTNPSTGFNNSIVTYARRLDRDAFAASEKIVTTGDELFGFNNVAPTVPSDGDLLIYTTISSGTERATADERNSELRFVAGDNISISVADGSPDTITISATDNDAINQVNNQINGTDVIDVRGATIAVPINVPAGDLAYVSPTEVWANVTGVDVDVTGPDFDFDGNGFLRIGNDNAGMSPTPDTDAVINVTGDSTTIHYVPAGSIAWFSNNEQYANDSGEAMFVRFTDLADIMTNASWLKIGDGTGVGSDVEWATITVDSPAGPTTPNITAKSDNDVLDFRTGAGLALTSDNSNGSETITWGLTTNPEGIVTFEPNTCLFRDIFDADLSPETRTTTITLENANALTPVPEVGRTIDLYAADQFTFDDGVGTLPAGTLIANAVVSHTLTVVRVGVRAGGPPFGGFITITVEGSSIASSELEALFVKNQPEVVVHDGDDIVNGDLCVDGNILLRGRILDKNGNPIDFDIDGDGDGGGDGDGDTGGGDEIDTDDGDGNPIGNGDGILGLGAGTCVTVNSADLTGCWTVGNTLSGLSTTDGDCGFSGIIESISETTVNVAGNYTVDTNGNQEGTLISGTTEYFEWEITSVVSGNNSNDYGLPFEFITPTNNGAGSIITRITVLVHSTGNRIPLSTVEAVNRGYVGKSIVGRWSGLGPFAEDSFNNIPIGASVTIGNSVGGTVTYRKNRVVRTIPIPQTFNAFTRFDAAGTAFSGTGGEVAGVFQYNSSFPLFSTVGGVDTATANGVSYQVNTVLWPNDYIDNNRAAYTTFLINTQDLGTITVGRSGTAYADPIPASPVATTVTAQICLANLEVNCGITTPPPSGTAGDPIVISVHSPGTPNLTNFISGTTNQVLELAGDVDFNADFLTNVQEALARIEYWDAAPNPNPIPGRRDGLFNWITYQSGGSGFSFLTASGFGRGRTRISAINGNTIASGTSVVTALGNTLQPGQFEIFWNNSQVTNVGLGGPMSLRFNYPSAATLARTTTSTPPVSTDFTFDKTANAVLGSTGLNDVIRFTNNVSATPTEINISMGTYALTIGVCPEPITTTSLTSTDLIVEGNATLLGEISTILGDGVVVTSGGDVGSTPFPGNTTTFYRGDGTFATVDSGVSYTGADNTVPLSNGINAANGFDASPITVASGATTITGDLSVTGVFTATGNTINIAADERGLSDTKVINIGSQSRATGFGFGTETINIGSTAAQSNVNINGTAFVNSTTNGTISIDGTGANSAISIGTGTASGAITIGRNNAASTISLASNVTIAGIIDTPIISATSLATNADGEIIAGTATGIQAAADFDTVGEVPQLDADGNLAASPITVAAGGTTFVESAITTSEAFAVPPSASFDFSNVFTQIFIQGGIAGFAAFTDGSRIRITDGVGTVDVIYNNDEVTSPVAGISISQIPGVDYSAAPTLSNANGAIVFTQLEEVATAVTATVTGDLTVTGNLIGSDAALSSADINTFTPNTANAAGSNLILEAAYSGYLPQPGDTLTWSDDFVYTSTQDGNSGATQNTVLQGYSQAVSTVATLGDGRHRMNFAAVFPSPGFAVSLAVTIVAGTISISGTGAVTIAGDLTATGTIGNPAASGSASFFVEDTGATSVAGAYQFTIADTGDTGTAGFITFVRE